MIGYSWLDRIAITLRWAPVPGAPPKRIMEEQEPIVEGPIGTTKLKKGKAEIKDRITIKRSSNK